MKMIQVYKYRIRRERKTISTFLSDHLLDNKELNELLNSYAITERNNLEFRAKIHLMVTSNAPSYNESTDL